MTRFVVDAGVVLHLAAEGLSVPAGHQVLAPTLIRSQALSMLHESVHRGEVTADDAQRMLGHVGRMKMRLLGDAVLRRTAWKLADQLDWASTYDAEYLALTQLQANAFVTLNKQLARQAAKIVAVASVENLLRARS